MSTNNHIINLIPRPIPSFSMLHAEKHIPELFLCVAPCRLEIEHNRLITVVSDGSYAMESPSSKMYYNQLCVCFVLQSQ